jgi:tetratricopeptide (TPR) repeat protein
MTAKKKPRGGAKKGPRAAGAGAKKTPRGARTAMPAAPASMSRGSMESALAALFGGRRSASGPLDEAQQLMYQAWESPSRPRRLELAGKALELSPDCADAYVLLAQERAASPAEAAELYRKAVEAGARALGKRAFKDDVGHFWGLLETRPYMRARAGLAQALRAAGQTDEAIAHYRDMLRLNPNDNQGVRYDLAACLLDAGRDVDLALLLDQYAEDISAAWAYARALLAFRTGGDTERARELLAAARAANPHVPAYLLGRKKLPKRQPDYIQFGDDTEAIVYAGDHASGWKHSPGALDWLAAQERAGAKPRRA